MRVISTEEMMSMNFKERPGHDGKERKTNLVKYELDKLLPNQVLFVEKSDWDIKSSPSCMINSWYVKPKTGKTFASKTLRDESGWVVKRLK